MNSKSVRLLILAAGLLAVDQAVQFTALRDGVFRGQFVAPFDPPLFTEWQVAKLAEMEAVVASGKPPARSLIDAELGWCPTPGSNVFHEYDWAGARVADGPLAREKSAGVRRVVAVGGSFTEGAEVEGTETWLAVVDRERDDLEIANLGVRGFGPDQAYMRLERDGLALAPDEVWLGYMPRATMRIVTLFAPAYRHWSSVVLFKPRFELDSAGELRLVPNPAPDYASFVRLLSDQEAFYAEASADFWVRRSPAAFAPRGSSWMHWFASTRLALSLLEAGERDPDTWLSDPDGEVSSLLTAIVHACESEAEAVGAKLRVVVLPSRWDLESCQDGSEPYWNAVVESWRAGGIDCIDTTPVLLEAGAATEDSFWKSGGHYSPKGNRTAATALLERL